MHIHLFSALDTARKHSAWALENTVVATSMPTIVRALDIGDNYVWITNAFFLTRYALSICTNIFGRRWLTLFIVAVFTLGSGICGGASNENMLIIGRAVQGIGSGGVNMIVDVIVSDLVPLRERGNFIASVLTVYAVGSANGPFVGGIIVERTSWRWRDATFAQRLKRIDYLSNFLIMGATAAVLCALTYGGSRYPCGSWRIIVPLVLGLLGMAAFMAYEGSSFCKEPVVPPRLCTNRTSLVVLINTYLFTVLLYWVLFFIPVYFQGILGSSPSRAGDPLAESDQAAATASWSFMRSFGNVWGVAIPASIFNNQVNRYAYRIPDASVRQLLSTGNAYEHISSESIGSLDEPVRGEVIGVLTDALELVWQVSVVFSGVAFLLVVLEKQVPLRAELETEYGMEEKGSKVQKKKRRPGPEDIKPHRVAAGTFQYTTSTC
ncbi:major facilitator superfamily domain-containing protein [Aspergillus karnatakaensis]|uniref:major facilitator superfamily domain-containing protein n=1 Tax=Aspergillus karnatakaensis TaxID=1810916 RepID=UPI003CCE3113